MAMESSGLTTAILSVDDIAALTDAELAEFMKKNRLPGGGYELPVDGWDKLSEDERNQFAERLKAQEQALASNPMAWSHTLDLDKLDARLRDAFDNNSDASSRARRRTVRRTMTPPDFEDVARENETEAYHNLTRDGGRPLYHIDLLEQVSRSWADYQEMLRPWRYAPDRKNPWDNYPLCQPWEVFQRQLKGWKDFRRWQKDNRGLAHHDDDFPGYVEHKKRVYTQHYTKEGYSALLAKIDADPSYLKPGWEFRQAGRAWKRKYDRERGCVGFPDYVKAVKRRLARHNFTRPFQLKEDPKLQDDLTTWIEYLYFEYWWLDRYAGSIDRLKPDHDRAWQGLVDSKVLRPHETEAFLRTDASAMQRQGELDQAIEAEKAAASKAKEVYILTQMDSRRQNLSVSERCKMLRVARVELEAAKERLKRTKERNSLVTNFIRSTFDYRDAVQDTARHKILLQWVLEQVPLIEAEMMQSKATETESSVVKQAKRSLALDDEVDSDKRDAKKQKLEHPETGSLSGSGAPAPPETRKRRTRARFAAADEQRRPREEAQSLRTDNKPRGRRSLRSAGVSPRVMPQGPRRSARIAARQNFSTIPLAPKLPRRKPR